MTSKTKQIKKIPISIFFSKDQIPKDYKRVKFEEYSSYSIYKTDEEILINISKISHFNTLQKNYKFKTTSIKSLGRSLVFDRTLNKIVVADFKFICSYKFSPNDYIAMAEAFEWFFIDEIFVHNSFGFDFPFSIP